VRINWTSNVQISTVVECKWPAGVRAVVPAIFQVSNRRLVVAVTTPPGPVRPCLVRQSVSTGLSRLSVSRRSTQLVLPLCSRVRSRGGQPQLIYLGCYQTQQGHLRYSRVPIDLPCNRTSQFSFHAELLGTRSIFNRNDLPRDIVTSFLPSSSPSILPRPDR
jgi:hypothetical protein